MSEISSIPQPASNPRLIVGISGASGAIYGARLLELLRPLPVETHLVISRSAEITLTLEAGLKPAAVRQRADVVHAIGDLAAPISSGSFKTIGMVVAPCSIRSMAEIASGVTTTLLSRAADVVLKERRLLVLLVRETPLHVGHLRTMTALAEMGAVIAPPVPAFYARPQTIAEMVDHTLGRILDLYGLDSGTVRRWGEPGSAEPTPLAEPSPLAATLARVEPLPRAEPPLRAGTAPRAEPPPLAETPPLAEPPLATGPPAMTKPG